MDPTTSYDINQLLVQQGAYRSYWQPINAYGSIWWDSVKDGCSRSLAHHMMKHHVLDSLSHQSMPWSLLDINAINWPWQSPEPFAPPLLASLTSFGWDVTHNGLCEMMTSVSCHKITSRETSDDWLSTDEHACLRVPIYRSPIKSFTNSLSFTSKFCTSFS